MLIRSAASDELPRLAGVTGRDAAWTRRTVKRLQQPTSAVFVAEERGEVAGFVTLRIIRRGHPAGGRPKRLLNGLFRSRAGPDSIIQPLCFGFLDDVHVCPAFQKREVTRALVLAGLEWLRSRQVTEVHRMTAAGDEESEGLLGSLGFEPMRFILCRKC